jgi:hypothetical protein
MTATRTVPGEESSETLAPVRLCMPLADAQLLAARLLAERGSRASLQLRELLWMRAVFIEQLRRVPTVERTRFERRADRVLAQFWGGLEAVCPSETTNTVGRDEKR